MSISPSFDTSALRIRLKAAEDKVKAFESGEKYVRMQKQFQAIFREQNAKIRRLKEELGRAHAQTVSVRKMWSDIYDDVYRKRMRGNLPCAKRSHTLSSASLKWNAREMPHWTDCVMNCGIKTMKYTN